MKILLCCLLLAMPALAKETADADLDLARRLESVFVKVAAQASESVVVISTKTKASSRPDADEDEDIPEQFRQTPFEYFFRHHPGLPQQRPHDAEGQGSGVIIRADGYILTNNHVVDGADEIKVRLQDGRELVGKLIGHDPRSDIAVVKVDGKDLPVAKLGDSNQIKVGQWAFAIGAPFAYDYSFTVGFISAKERPALSRTRSVYDDFIQTDASINPGNSGGPLCDLEGRVIGINTLIRGMNTGIGFAIPINNAREIADQLITNGRIVRPWIGIEGRALTETPELREFVKDVKEGVVVTRVVANAPAARGGLKPTDIIISVDGVKVRTLKELQQQVLHKRVGQDLAVDIVRDGKPMKLTLKTAEMTDDALVAGRKPPEKVESAFGLEVQTLTKDLAKQFNVDETEGVIVTSVVDGSIAEDAGLRQGDVITEVSHTTIHNAEEFNQALAKADAKKGVLLFVKRAGAATFVVLKEK